MIFEADNFPLTVGDTVPEDLSFDVFQNNSIDNKSFKDFRGKWVVLFFYPGDFTFVCPTELAELAAMYEQFTEASAEIISVSTDSAFVHKAWHDTSDAIKTVNYPMAADPSHELSELFGTLIPEVGESLRGTFIISPDGVIKAVEINDNSIGRCAKETLRKFKAAKFVGEHPANVCPASWNEGDDVLTPGVDLVGKI
ncbi:MAG: redoxin domain-containing protein [Candidatus Pacebacteria bacterium]|nr:redoxin domain-containing protein [Candidatus Paceibacterota bacterium]